MVIVLLFLLLPALLGRLWAVVVVVFVVEVVCRSCFVVAVVLKTMGRPKTVEKPYKILEKNSENGGKAVKKTQKPMQKP